MLVTVAVFMIATHSVSQNRNDMQHVCSGMFASLYTPCAVVISHANHTLTKFEQIRLKSTMVRYAFDEELLTMYRQFRICA